MGSEDDKEQRQSVAARALWEDLAVKARTLHCPEHYAQPWRITVLGDKPGNYRLYVQGCCAKIGDTVNGMIRSDPRMPARR